MKVEKRLAVVKKAAEWVVTAISARRNARVAATMGWLARSKVTNVTVVGGIVFALNAL